MRIIELKDIEQEMEPILESFCLNKNYKNGNIIYKRWKQKLIRYGKRMNTITATHADSCRILCLTSTETEKNVLACW